MYKLLFALLMTVGMTTAMCAQQKQKMNSKHSNSKILVAYFSATGTTARAAEKLVEAVGGDLYPIAPAQSYTSADLDWNNKQSRSSVEMNNPKMRPAIKSKKENIGTYDVVFIGYPIWWDANYNPKRIKAIEKRMLVNNGCININIKNNKLFRILFNIKEHVSIVFCCF